MQLFCTTRDTRPKHETNTQHKRDLFAKRRTNRKGKKNKNNHHNPVFFHTNKRDSYPYASPEGHGTTPSKMCQRWSAVRPLGAAMRLTVLRQSFDISRQSTNSRHTKPIPDPQKDSLPQLPCECKPISANTKKIKSAGPNYAPYGGATRNARKPAHPSPLSEPITLTTGTRKIHMSPNAKTNRHFPRVQLLTNAHCPMEKSLEQRQGSEMQPRDDRRETAHTQHRDAPN